MALQASTLAHGSGIDGSSCSKQILRLFFDESPLKSACGLDGRKKHSGDGVFLGDR